MLAVPWLIGWALKPYIQINDQADATKSEKRLSAAVAKAQLSSLVVDSGSNPTPGGSSASDEPAPQEKLIQATVVSKTAAVKSTHSATAGPSRIPQIVKPQQSESPPESGYTTKVSTYSITLKMSSEWAQQQIEQFRFTFEEADHDKSGWLSFAEVLNVLEKAGFKGTPEEAKVR